MTNDEIMWKIEYLKDKGKLDIKIEGDIVYFADIAIGVLGGDPYAPCPAFWLQSPSEEISQENTTEICPIYDDSSLVSMISRIFTKGIYSEDLQIKNGVPKNFVHPDFNWKGGNEPSATSRMVMEDLGKIEKQKPKKTDRWHWEKVWEERSSLKKVTK